MSTQENTNRTTARLIDADTALQQVSVMLQAPVDADAPDGVAQDVQQARTAVSDALQAVATAAARLQDVGDIYYRNTPPPTP